MRSWPGAAVLRILPANGQSGRPTFGRRICPPSASPRLDAEGPQDDHPPRSVLHRDDGAASGGQAASDPAGRRGPVGPGDRAGPHDVQLQRGPPPGAGPMTAGPARPLDVLIVGGGQAGLAMGYHLAQRGLRFQIVDAGPELGSPWRSRWDTLQLFTPGRYDNLPGLLFPAEADA